MKSHLLYRILSGTLLLVFASPWCGSAADSAADLLSRARSAQQRGARDEALKLATSAIAAEPENADAYMTRGLLYENAGDWEKAVADFTGVLRLNPREAGAWQQRGAAQFRLGKIRESIADFDRFLELQPDQAPYHWQRGIALYYAGRYEDGAKQFESHKSVNANDVENAAWHYLCVARATNPAKARASLIAIDRDPRPPMMQIHAMFAGKATPEDVLAAAGADDPAVPQSRSAHFYAHLYIGLYHEANGNAGLARKHILFAAEKYADAGYMSDVARVHANILRKQPR